MPRDTVQDTVEFDLLAERTVVNKTVKLIANIAAMIKSDMPEAILTTNVQAMMKNFLDASWSFSNMQRSADQSGMERISLQASARVPESQNYNLDKRTRAASTEGLSIISVQADTTPPMADIEQAESDLRADLLVKAIRELTVVNKAMGVAASTHNREYRVGRVTFESVDNSFQMSNSSRGSTKTAMATAYGAGFGADMPGGEEGLGNAVKLTMRATVEYRRSPKDKA